MFMFKKYISIFSECCVRVHSGALLTVGEGGTRKGHTKSASISAAGARHSDLPPLDTNLDSALRAR